MVSRRKRMHRQFRALMNEMQIADPQSIFQFAGMKPAMINKRMGPIIRKTVQN